MGEPSASAEDVIEELPTPVRAAARRKGFMSFSAPKSRFRFDELVERSGLNSSEVLATLFTLETKGIVRQLPGKQLCKVLL